MLFVFAHQDDEMAVASRILFEIRAGASVHCVYLTDGTARGASASTRNDESLAVLHNLGVSASRVHFHSVEDGTLVHHLDSALERVLPLDASAVYCLAWEGGHQDHDASQLVAAAFARRRGVDCWEMPLYRGVLGGRLFRVMSPLPGAWERRRISLGEAVRLVLLPRKYVSQRSSWLGLFPESFVKIVLLRRELMRRAEASRYRQRPHAGTLFYEKRFRFPYEEFARAAKPFIDREFPDTR